MAVALNPYLNFPGTAREAMTFYQSVLGGQLTMNTFGEYGAEGPGAEGIMHAQLETPDGLTLMASDMPPGSDGGASGSAGTSSTSMTCSLSGDDDKLRDFWTGLAQGGEVQMPFEKQMWGDEFGALTDRYGIPWMVNLGPGADGGDGGDGGSAEG